MDDPGIARAVTIHAKEHELDESAVWRTVSKYIDEIVPFFNILAYYRFGYAVSRVLLNVFYRVSADQHSDRGASTLPRNAVVVYLMNPGPMGLRAGGTCSRPSGFHMR